MPTAAEITYLTARITKTEALIAAYEDAMLALSTGAQVYTLDTGQTRQSVTKANLGSMRLQLDSLENRRETLIARRDGGGHIGRPGF